MKALVTGGAGFIGSNFIRYILERKPDWEIFNYDALTYAGNLENLKDIENNPRYKFVKGDISDPDALKSLFSNRFDYVLNFAAESHVDRSLYDPALFLRTNVLGTQLLLKFAMESGVGKFLHVSTDEVYGSLGPEGLFRETSPLAPNSPYAASKASADMICRAYYKTFAMPIVVTRAGNNYGPYQFPEKLIPFFITLAMNDEKLPLYGDGMNVRDWLYVEDHCSGILTVLENGVPGEVYNIGGKNEMSNLDITAVILKELGKSRDLIKFVKDRPGHDKRYALSTEKIESELGWKPKKKFDDGIRDTVKWYLENQTWWQNIKSGEYLKFYDIHYKDRS